MKRFITAAAIFAIALPALAGITYKVESSASGSRGVTLAAIAKVEGANARMNITRGDGMLFLDNSFVLARDGGKSLLVYDPSSMTYYELRPEQITASVASLLGQLGAAFKFDVVNPRVSVRDLGAGGTIAGYPTRHVAIDSSYGIALDAMGQKMTMAISTKTETWATEKIAASAATFLQSQGLRTGIEQLDKLIAAQAAAVKGFPLRNVVTMKVMQNGTPAIESTTTTSVSDIAFKAIPPSEFAPPDGYVKTQNPLEKLMGGLTK